MSSPKLVSIQVGSPKRHGVVGSKNSMERPYESGIYKETVSGPVWLGALNLDGDGQADLGIAACEGAAPAGAQKCRSHQAS